ncbi:MAG: hypothetical protein Q8N31_11355 [Reyranella sp.]|nr:hypothetical protein [Reyranella sp.]MDP3160606.1 hypothetical protein [Reyranella sp.]
MAFTSRAGLVLIAFLLLSAGPVSAQQTWAVLAKMGVGGTWAAVCAEDANDSNWFHTYYGDKSGVARRRADRGAALPPLNSTIDSSQNLTPTTFLMRIRNDDAGWGESNQVAYDVIAEITPRGLHSLSSTRTSDGKQFIKDGKFIANGNPVRLFQRCK